MNFYSVSNTAGIQAKDVMIAHDVVRVKDWADVKDAAQCALDRIMELPRMTKQQGCDGPMVIQASFVAVDCGEFEENILIFHTMDEDGVFVTWQVIAL